MFLMPGADFSFRRLFLTVEVYSIVDSLFLSSPPSPPPPLFFLCGGGGGGGGGGGEGKTAVCLFLW